MKQSLFVFVICIFIGQGFAQSSTGAPPPSATTPLTLQHLSQIKNKDPEETFVIKATNGNMVAKLDKIIFDAKTEQPRFAVLHSFDNVTDGMPFTIVPWELLKIERPSGDIVIQSSVDELRKAPKINAQNLPAKVEGNWGQEYYKFYKVKPWANPNAVGSSGMLPSGTIKGSGANTPQAPNAGRASRVFLWSSVAAAVLVFLLLVFNIRRTARRS